jgi:hypothetical protein
MDGVAEKIIKPVNNEDAIIAPLLITAFIRSGLLSDVLIYSQRSARVRFPMTRPPAQGVENNVSRSWGLASLMHAR